MTTGDLGKDSSYIELVNADGQSTSTSKSRDKIDWIKLLAVLMSAVQGYNIFSHVSSILTLSQSIHFLIAWYRYYIGFPFRWLNLNISSFDQDLIVLLAIAFSAASYSWKQNYGVSIFNYWVPELGIDQSSTKTNKRPTGLIISTYKNMNKLSTLIGFVIGLSSFVALLYLVYSLDQKIIITAYAVSITLIGSLILLVVSIFVRSLVLFVFFRDAFDERYENRQRELAQSEDIADEQDLHNNSGVYGDYGHRSNGVLENNDEVSKKFVYELIDEFFKLHVFRQILALIVIPLYYFTKKFLRDCKAVNHNKINIFVIRSLFNLLLQLLLISALLVILPIVVILVYSIMGIVFGFIFFSIPYWIVPFYLAVMIGTRPIAVIWMVGAVAGLILLSHLFTYVVDPYVIPYLQNLPQPPS